MKDGAGELKKLQDLDRRAPEQVANLRAVTQGWGPDDGRWDALLAAFEWERRDQARKLAEEIRAFTITPSGHPSYDDGKDAGLDAAADLIDPEVSK